MQTTSENTTPHNAAEYDQQIFKTIPYYECFYTETIDLIRWLQPAPQDWLDTGCGTGNLIVRAAPIFPTTRFLLADPAADMLAQAKQRLQDVPQVIFYAPTTSQQLSTVIESTPAVITAIQCHHYLSAEERRQATRACYRLLAQDGLYITFENIQPTTAAGEAIALNRWMRYQRGQGRSEAVVQEHRQRYNRNYFPITVAQHLDLLQTTGFRVVELLWYSQMQAGFYAIK